MNLKAVHGFGLAVLVLAATGCSHLQRGPINNNESSSEVKIYEVTQNSGELSPTHSDKEGYEHADRFGEIHLDVNKKVLQWINYYQTRGRKHMERYLSRSTKYLPTMKGVLREHGMPEDLAYLVIVESGFNPVAHSHAAAVGFWQFIGATGKRYGLEINSYLDERMDPVQSSHAAAKYLGTLYEMFGDWHLALAAYNTGEGRVHRVVRRFRTKNFWKIASQRRRSLARETKNYVPKYIAATLIAKNPERYGFRDIDYQMPLSVDTIKVAEAISLDKLAGQLGVTYEELKALNPRYRSDFVPARGEASSVVYVPKGMADKALGAVTLASADGPLRKLAPTYHVYRVRRGDSLSVIARKYRTRVSTLRRLNNLSRRSFIRVGQRLKVPNRYGRAVAAKSSSKLAKESGSGVVKVARKSSSTRTETHRVRRGENLTLIARKYGVSVNQLRSWNGLRRGYVLRPGKRLKVYNNGKRIHLVRRGENLSTIARKYRVALSELVQLNQIVNRSKLSIGTSLVIPD